MGYDPSRFVGDEVDEEFLCSICSMVFENPVETPCDHTFCNDCLVTWLSKHAECPIDSTVLLASELKTPGRLFRNLLAKLKIKCDFGRCDAIVELGHLRNHLADCESNPLNAEIVCDKGCAWKMRRCEQQTHNCLAHLLNLNDRQQVEITKLTNECRKLTTEVDNLQHIVQREQEIARLSNLVNRLEVEVAKLTSEAADRKDECRKSSVETASLKSMVEEQIDSIRRLTDQIYVTHPVMRWKFDEGLKFCQQSNVLESVKGFLQCASSKDPLRPENPSLKVEILHLTGFIWIGLKPSCDEKSLFGADSIHFRSDGYAYDLGTRFENLERWKVGDVIECGIRNPENLNGNADGAEIVVYFSINGNLVMEKSVKVPTKKHFPRIEFYGIGTKVKILRN